MGFIEYFSNQARKPSGFVGRYIISRIFENGNSIINNFVFETMDLQKDDCVLEIGFGPGKLIQRMAGVIENGRIDGVDFSGSMYDVASKRNRIPIQNQRVSLKTGDFEKIEFNSAEYHQICCVNTIYFWTYPVQILNRIYDLLKPGGRLVLGFTVKNQLENRKLSRDVFRFYEAEEIREMLAECRFQKIQIHERKSGRSLFHCMTAFK